MIITRFTIYEYLLSTLLDIVIWIYLSIFRRVIPGINNIMLRGGLYYSISHKRDAIQYPHV